ncbi:hypothetical protein R1flu_013302 [Riccia fluitans]|uniref:ACT domain-containing protein n=1 Tax=Riccia fluitans TaxID=41844 RepID=A0ABD1YCW1_9MARC
MQGQVGRTREILQEIVERIGWVYAGLWQPVASNNSLVVWAAGYYNGPILENGETPVPANAQWSERKERRRVLEELQAMPEGRLTSNLSNIEWFYFISSKFQFPFGQDGTPAKMLLTGGLEWTCDGDEINGAMSSRTDLIKAAGMKTILCLAVTGGVVEIGTTALVEQNLHLVQYVRNMFERGLGTQKVQIVSSLLGHDQTDDHSGNGLLFSPSSSAAKFSSLAPTTLGMSNSSAGPGLGLAPPYQTNLTSLGTLQQISSFGMDSLPFAPSLLNGLLREQGPELNLQQAAGGSWDLSVEQHLMQEQNMIPANLKHKMTEPTSALTKSGSCVASFKQALLPRAQHISQRGGSHPVESTGKLLSNFQAQLFSQPQVQHQINSSAETVVSDSPRHSPPVAPPLLDSMKDAAAKTSPDIPWRGISTQSQGIGSPPKLPRVESGGKGLAELSKIDNTSFKSHQLGGQELHQHNFNDLLPSSNHSHGQHTQFLPELTGEGQNGHSADHSWSSEAISPTISEQDQVPEDGYSLWEDSENLENGRFLDGSIKQDRSKKARLCGARSLNINTNQSTGTTSGIGNFLDQTMTERQRQESEKFQALRRMLQPHSASNCDNATIPGDAIEQMRDLQRRVKESESTTTSSASDDGQNPRSSGRTSSLTTSLVQEVNPVNINREFSHQTAAIRQQRYGRSGGGDNGPLLKLSDVFLDTNEDLDGVHLGIVDDIPQIEVRMMENDHVMIKFSTKDRPNLFTDIMFALQDLHLQVQHANIRTVHGVVHDVYAAKVDVTLLEKQSTGIIAEAIRQAIERGYSTNCSSPNPATPDANPNVNSPRKRPLQTC